MPAQTLSSNAPPPAVGLGADSSRYALIEAVETSSAPGGIIVHDEHIENMYEMIFAALADYPYTIVHAGERHGFQDRSAWERAVKLFQKRRRKLAFE